MKYYVEHNSPGVTGVYSTTTMPLGASTSISYTVTNAQCGSASASRTVYIRPLSDTGTVTPLRGSVVSLCIGNQITFTSNSVTDGLPRYGGTTYGHTWTSTNSSVASINSSTGVVTALKAGTVDIKYFTTPNGCGSFNTKGTTITIKPNFTLTASSGTGGSISSSGATTVCSGNNQSFTITPNAGYTIADVLVDGVSQGAITTYTFSNVTANRTISASFALSCTPTTGTFTTSACGSYTWVAKGNKVYTASNNTDTIKLVNAGGCDSIVTLNLTINNATNSTTNVNICGNQIPYNWNGTNYSIAGTYTKTGLVNVGGCDSIATLVLSIGSPITPTVSISTPNDTVCNNVSVTFTAISSTGGASPVFNWQKSGISVGSGSSISFPGGTLTTGDVISCVLTANNSCQTTATANSNTRRMVVKTSPAIGTSTGFVMCTIGATAGIYNTNPGSGIWSSNNTNVATVATSNGASGVVTAVSNGTVILTYSKTAANGCVSSAPASVVVAAVPTLPNISGASSVCINSSTALSNATSGGVWSATNNRSSVNSAGIVTGLSAGIATIKYTVTNSNGCNNSANYNLTVNSLPNVPTFYYATGTLNPQTGAGGTFCANRIFTNVGNPLGGVWSKTGVITVGASSGIVNTGSVAGAATLTYTISDVNGCSNNRTISSNVSVCAARGVNLATNEKQETRNEFTMYPNPAHSFISLSVNSLIGAGSVVVTDLYGKQVKTQSLSMGTNTIDISKLGKGMYFVSTITNEGKTTKKLVVE
jgi:Secretion system C-terminal sorting domain/Bacterial Ig-like domain (group 2)